MNQLRINPQREAFSSSQMISSQVLETINFDNGSSNSQQEFTSFNKTMGIPFSQQQLADNQQQMGLSSDNDKQNNQEEKKFSITSSSQYVSPESNLKMSTNSSSHIPLTIFTPKPQKLVIDFKGINQSESEDCYSYLPYSVTIKQTNKSDVMHNKPLFFEQNIQDSIHQNTPDFKPNQFFPVTLLNQFQDEIGQPSNQKISTILNENIQQGKVEPTFLNNFTPQSSLNSQVEIDKIVNQQRDNKNKLKHNININENQSESIHQSNQEIVRFRENGKQEESSNQNVQQQINELKKQLSTKQKIIENTYQFPFLLDKEKEINFTQILENYVLLCVENQKLSDEIIEKIAKINCISAQFKNLNIEKEVKEQSLHQKVNELSADIQILISENEKLKCEFERSQSGIQLTQKEAQNLKEQNLQLQQNIQNYQKEKEENQANYETEKQINIIKNDNLLKQIEEEITLKNQQKEYQSQFENKVIQIIEDNESLNHLLSKRIDEVTYLQNFITQLQSTYATQFTSDSRFQIAVQQIEDELLRVNEIIENHSYQKEQDDAKIKQLEEQNNRAQIQLLEQQGSISNEIIIKEKKEQVKELLLKIERIERSLDLVEQQKNELQIQNKYYQEIEAKLQRKYDEKEIENKQMFITNIELSTELKQKNSNRDQSLIDNNHLEYDPLELKRMKIEMKVNQIDRESKEEDILKLKSQVEINKEQIEKLKKQISQSDDKVHNLSMEVVELKNQQKETKLSLESSSIIEKVICKMQTSTDHQKKSDEESRIEASNLEVKCQNMIERLLIMSIENERLHGIIKIINDENQEDKAKMGKKIKETQEELMKINQIQQKQERGQFQQANKKKELQLGDQQLVQDNLKTDSFIVLQQEFQTLKKDFKLAIETLKSRDQQIIFLQQKLNHQISDNRNNCSLQQMEQKLLRLQTENIRINNILIERVQFQKKC